VLEKMDDVDRVETPDSGNAPDAICSSLADDSLSQVVKMFGCFLFFLKNDYTLLHYYIMNT